MRKLASCLVALAVLALAGCEAAPAGPEPEDQLPSPTFSLEDSPVIRDGYAHVDDLGDFTCPNDFSSRKGVIGTELEFVDHNGNGVICRRCIDPDGCFAL